MCREKRERKLRMRTNIKVKGQIKVKTTLEACLKSDLTEPKNLFSSLIQFNTALKVVL